MSATLGVRGIPPILRFLIVGASAVGLNLVLLWLLVGRLGWPYLVATVVVFFAGNLWGYLANRRFTWQSTERPAPEIARWYGVMATSLFITLAGMYVLVDGLGIYYLLANIVLSIAMAFVNFIAHDRFTFRVRTPLEEGPEVPS